MKVFSMRPSFHGYSSSSIVAWYYERAWNTLTGAKRAIVARAVDLYLQEIEPEHRTIKFNVPENLEDGDQCGVQGIVWPQNSSEQRYLTKEERIRGFEVLAEANRGRGMSLTLGVQADDTAGMLEYARVAESLEPDGMIAIPPTSADSLAQIRAYYAALCEITSRPIFVQTSGGPEIELPIDFLVQLARDFPQCGYIKEEYGDVHARMLALQEFQPDPIRSVFGATLGRGWLYEMRIGTDGVMTGGTMYGDVYARLWQLHLEGRELELAECYSKLLLIQNLDTLIPQG